MQMLTKKRSFLVTLWGFLDFISYHVEFLELNIVFDYKLNYGQTFQDISPAIFSAPASIK